MPNHRSSRDAFTLLELLIVLAVLAGMAALSWPAVSGLLAKSEIRSAAKQVRAALTRARLDAMESGTVHQFRYQAGTGRFEIAAVTGPANEGPESGLSGPVDREASENAENTLPSGVCFESPGGYEDGLGFAKPAVLPGEERWSAPLLFFPNGRTSSAKLRLRGRRDYSLQLSLRGVTGTVTLGKLEQAEEQP